MSLYHCFRLQTIQITDNPHNSEMKLPQRLFDNLHIQGNTTQYHESMILDERIHNSLQTRRFWIGLLPNKGMPS